MRNKRIIAKRIEQLCKEKDLSYYMLSYKSSVPITTIMNIVNCRTQNPGVCTILKLCEGFKISASDFFDIEELRRDDKL